MRDDREIADEIKRRHKTVCNPCLTERLSLSIIELDLWRYSYD
jgi:hypothetical protein